MVRPRRLDDDALLDRIARAAARRPATRPWTLADLAADVGLSPAGILRRFGSRHGVLRALCHRWIASIPTEVADRAAAERELRAWVTVRFGWRDTDHVVRGLVDLLDDLADEELRRCLADGWAREVAYLEALLGHLSLPRLTDPARGARLLFDALNGAVFRQATRPDPAYPHTVVDDFLELWT